MAAQGPPGRIAAARARAADVGVGRGPGAERRTRDGAHPRRQRLRRHRARRARRARAPARRSPGGGGYRTPSQIDGQRVSSRSLPGSAASQIARGRAWEPRNRAADRPPPTPRDFVPPCAAAQPHVQSIYPSLPFRRAGVERRASCCIRRSRAVLLDCGDGVRLLALDATQQDAGRPPAQAASPCCCTAGRAARSRCTSSRSASCCSMPATTSCASTCATTATATT